MKPKTKLQKEVAALSSQLPPLTQIHEDWAYKKFMGYHYIQSRGKCYCVECEHVWNDSRKVSRLTCPECGRKLSLLKGYKSPHVLEDYFAIVTTLCGYQVIRICIVTKVVRNKKMHNFFIEEVIQHWISGTGEFTALSIRTNQSNNRCDAWNYGSQMEIRELSSMSSIYRHSIVPYAIYPERKVLPILRRNGFTGSTSNTIPYKLLIKILTDPMAETLLKSGQYAALKAYVNEQRSLHRYWDSIKICIRNKYIIKDISMWTDYMDMLSSFNKDLRNAKYVCPVNLKNEHDLLLKKRNKVRAAQEQERRRQADERRRLNIEKRMRDVVEYQKKYEEQKGRFFDLCIKSKTMVVVVLKSIEEFKNESEALNHCVFDNEYYKEKDSLILSARLKENPSKPVETVEVSLKNMDIVQCRGFKNSYSTYHDSILSLVKRNLGLIAKRVAV